MAEGTPLEREQTVKRLAGSNPAFSAKYLIVVILYKDYINIAKDHIQLQNYYAEMAIRELKKSQKSEMMSMSHNLLSKVIFIKQIILHH